jgi:monofunctional biosynthetic peptidoglycan transglycosylase
VARDIASVADKDTRGDDETRGEVPFPDGPRSEGGPAPREPDVETTGRPARPAVPDEVPAAEPGDAAPDDAPSLSLVEAAEDFVESSPVSGVEADPTPEPDPVAEDDGITVAEPDHRPSDSREADGAATWRSAIADALAEPEVPSDDAQSADEEVASAGSERPFMTWIDVAAPAAEPDVALENSPQAERESQSRDAEPEPFEASVEPQPVAEAPDPETPSAGISEQAAAAIPAAVGAAAFTQAAEDLFRPPAFDRGEETHLITLGRRLDPSLRIPRPVPPVIEPRPEPEAEPASLQWWKSWFSRDRLRTAARYAAYAVGGYLALVLVLIVLFRFVNPPGSMLMLTQLLTGTAIDRTWVPLGSISSNLVRAVVVSEDDRFCEHSGIDTEAIRVAIERSSRGAPRGASTISMQVTKNLFLSNAKSYVRKVIEIPLTLVMELVWPKWRILEVYLNIAEWGPGVFGAEAAAQHHFNKPASRLSEREAALLASVLPNPLVRNAGSPGPQVSAKARVVQSRVKAYGAVASCVTAVAGKAPAASPAATVPRVLTRKQQPAARKTPAPRKKQPADDWSPTLNFGSP